MFDPIAKLQSAILQGSVTFEASLFEVLVVRLNFVFFFIGHGGKLLRWTGKWIFWVSVIHKKVIVPCKLEYIIFVFSPVARCSPQKDDRR
jgi:hypothetical protein